MQQTISEIDEARKSQIPIFLEYKTYRWLEHCGPNDDDALGYRPIGELGSWKSKDPLTTLEKLLVSDYGVSIKTLESIVRTLTLEVGEVFDRVRSDPFPTLQNAIQDVYA